MKSKNLLLNNKTQTNGHTNSLHMKNGKIATNQLQHQQQLGINMTNGKKSLDQKYLNNGHNNTNALINGSPKNNTNATNNSHITNINSKNNTASMNNKLSEDFNSLSSSTNNTSTSTSLLMPQAYLPKYVEKSFR